MTAVPCGSLAGELAAAWVLAASARAAGIAIRPTFARPEPVRRIARLVASEVGGSAVTRVNPVVDQLMAMLAGVAGGGTLLKLSGDVATVPTSLLQASLLPVLLTHLSDDFAAGNARELRAKVRRALASVVAHPRAWRRWSLWLVRRPLLHLVFGHGAMDVAGRRAHGAPPALSPRGPRAFRGAAGLRARARRRAEQPHHDLGWACSTRRSTRGSTSRSCRALGLEGIALSTSCTYAVVALVFAVRFRARLRAFRGARRRRTS